MDLGILWLLSVSRHSGDVGILEGGVWLNLPGDSASVGPFETALIVAPETDGISSANVYQTWFTFAAVVLDGRGVLSIILNVDDLEWGTKYNFCCLTLSAIKKMLITNLLDPLMVKRF